MLAYQDDYEFVTKDITFRYGVNEIYAVSSDDETLQAIVVIAPEDNHKAHDTGIVFPKKGVYFIVSYFPIGNGTFATIGFVNSLHLHGYDFTEVKDYTLTSEDKSEIVQSVLDSLPTWEGGVY